MPTNWKQLKAIEYKNKQKILQLCPGVPDTSGIYIFFREEDDFKYAYIGQAKHLLTRLAQHLSGYQHIDLSIRKHKLWSEKNLCGWKLMYYVYPTSELDDKEQYFIKEYANLGYQLRNKTSGSQSEGKFGISDNRPPKGYYDGLAQGYKNAQKYVANLFNKHLKYDKKSERPNKNQEKAMVKFENFLQYEKEE